MLARTVASPSLRAFALQRSAAVASVHTSPSPMGVFEDKERGDEGIHFRREDERLLEALLKKVRAAADKVSCL